MQTFLENYRAAEKSKKDAKAKAAALRAGGDDGEEDSKATPSKGEEPEDDAEDEDDVEEDKGVADAATPDADLKRPRDEDVPEAETDDEDAPPVAKKAK
jgi:hypothetical protein